MYVLPPVPRCSDWASSSLISPSRVSAFPEIAVGSACTSSFSRLAWRSLALRPAHSRRHLYVTRYTEGFSHFVTSMTAPVASGWSVRRVGLSPTGKRRLLTAHAKSGHSATASSPASSPQKKRVISGCIEVRRKIGPATAESSREAFPGAEKTRKRRSRFRLCARERRRYARVRYDARSARRPRPQAPCRKLGEEVDSPAPPSNTGAKRQMRLTSKD